MKYLTTSLLILIGVLLGFFLVILLPVVFVAWLNGWLADTWASIVGTPVRCDGGNLSPTGENDAGFTLFGYPVVYKEDTCRHGVTPADNCLMCAIEQPDDTPEEEALIKKILRDEWVRAVELWLEGVKPPKGGEE
jgi:hypothetical protein